MFSIPRIKAVGPDDDGSAQVQAGFGPAQNLSSGFDEWSCTVVITTTSLRHKIRLSFSYQCKRS